MAVCGAVGIYEVEEGCSHSQLPVPQTQPMAPLGSRGDATGGFLSAHFAFIKFVYVFMFMSFSFCILLNMCPFLLCFVQTVFTFDMLCISLLSVVKNGNVCNLLQCHISLLECIIG